MHLERLIKVADENRAAGTGYGLQSGQKVELKTGFFAGWAGPAGQFRDARSPWRSHLTNLLPTLRAGILRYCEGRDRRRVRVWSRLILLFGNETAALI